MGRRSDSTMINKSVKKRMLDQMRITIYTRESNVMNVKDMVTLDQNVQLFSKKQKKSLTVSWSEDDESEKDMENEPNMLLL